jgi:hypothetical protein
LPTLRKKSRSSISTLKFGYIKLWSGKNVFDVSYLLERIGIRGRAAVSRFSLSRKNPTLVGSMNFVEGYSDLNKYFDYQYEKRKPKYNWTGDDLQNFRNYSMPRIFINIIINYQFILESSTS